MTDLQFQLALALRDQSGANVLYRFRLLVHTTTEALQELAYTLAPLTSADELQPTVCWFQHQLPTLVEETCLIPMIPLTMPALPVLDAFRTQWFHNPPDPLSDWQVVQGLVGSFRSVVVVMGGMLDWYERPGHRYDMRAIPILRAMRAIVVPFQVLHTNLYERVSELANQT